MPVHYAPRTAAFRAESHNEVGRIAHLDDVAVISIGERGTPGVVRASWEFHLRSPSEAARQLYEILHRCDALGLRSILVILPPDQPEWQAVRDRLIRATRPLAERD
jgi:L-threonylcarbamoyladenylate synthase